MSRGRRRIRRGTALGGIALAIVGVTSAPASAHALLERSTPSANETLDRAPSALALMFTEPPDPGLSSIHLLDSSGRDIGLGPLNVTGRTITVPVTGSLADGTYTVAWRVVSRTDGHVTANAFAFGVGQPPSRVARGAGAPTESPFPSVLSVAAKWLLYVGLAVLLAAALIPSLVLRVRRLVAWPVVAAAGAAAVGWAGLVWAERSSIGVSASAFLTSESGRPYVWLGIAIAVAVAATLGWLASAKAPLLRVVGASAAAAMLVRAIGGHADSGSLPAIEITAQFLHLVAIGVWIGGLVWLALLVRGIDGAQRPEAVRRFSTTAGLALGVVAATGVIRAIDEIGGVWHLGRLFSTDYGWTLSAKVAASAALIALGAWNRYVNVPRTANGPAGTTALRRVVSAEVVLAAGILALTGLLTGLPPAVSVAAQQTSVANVPLVVSGSDFATTVRARVTIAPGIVGANHFSVRVADYDSGAPVPARRVSIGFTPMSHPDVSSSTLELRRAPDGEWMGSGSQISLDDRWQLLLVVQTATGSTQVHLEVSPRVPAGRTTQARSEGQPTLFTTTYAAGASLQTYVDPGTPGTNQVHATAFDANGDELPLRTISLIAIPPDGRAEVLKPIRFSPGHYAANVDVAPGTWTFEIRAASNAGATLDARFRQAFEGSG
jgi:copper transport protein